MTKGGYQIIDLQNKPLTSDVGMVYEGIYEKIEGTRKAILLSGLNVDGFECRDAFVSVSVVGSDFIIKYSDPLEDGYFGGTIRITDTDVVTCIRK